MMEEYEGAVGIDLGTTYSCVAVMRDGSVQVIPNDQGYRTTPSCVAFTSEERIIGDAAKQQAASNPTNTVYHMKRLIGRKLNDPQVQEDKKHWPFVLVEGGRGGSPAVQVTFKGDERRFSPEELSGFVLQKMKATAETYLGKRVTRAVVTVPAYFNDAQRRATKDAGEIAGLRVLRIINEPTAGALAFGLQEGSSNLQTVLVFDLGGGTFDVTLLSIENGAYEVMATSGDAHLGGEDFDQRLVEHCVIAFRSRNPKVKLEANPKAMERLRQACQRAKHTLSASTEASISVDGLIDGIDFCEKMSRARFEELNADLFAKTLEPVAAVLSDAKVEKLAVDEVVLIGGSTRIPKVRQLLAAYFNGKELNTKINPDEAVACGAAIEAFVLTGGRSAATNSLVLLDVIPMTLGIEVDGKMMSPVLKRNATIPTTRTAVYTTKVDNQKEICVKVLEGERPSASECHRLGEFLISNLTPAPRGKGDIDVTFSVSEDGILYVSAAEKCKTTNANGITIQNDANRLTAEDREVLRRLAAQFADEDAEFNLRHQVRCDLDWYIYRKQVELAALPATDRRKQLLPEVEKAAAWYKSNEATAKRTEFAQKLRELRRCCGEEPTVTPPVGSPFAGRSSGGGGVNAQNPLKIEEVD